MKQLLLPLDDAAMDATSSNACLRGLAAEDAPHTQTFSTTIAPAGLLHVSQNAHTSLRTGLDSRRAVSTTERAQGIRPDTGARFVRSLTVGENDALIEHPLGVVTAPSSGTSADDLRRSTSTDRRRCSRSSTEELPAARSPRTVEAIPRKRWPTSSTRLTRPSQDHRVCDPPSYRRARRRRARGRSRTPCARFVDHTPRLPSMRMAVPRRQDGGVCWPDKGWTGSQPSAVSMWTASTTSRSMRIEIGRGAVEVFSGILAEVVGELRSDRDMRWNDPRLSFSRPIRWLVAVLGEVAVPVVVGALTAGRQTRVCRMAGAADRGRTDGRGYLDLLDKHGIVRRLGAPPHLDRPSRAPRARGLLLVVTLMSTAESNLIDEITDLIEQTQRDPGRFRPELPGTAPGDPHHRHAQTPALPPSSRYQRHPPPALRRRRQRCLRPGHRAGRE